jgi:hypothetical protein
VSDALARLSTAYAAAGIAPPSPPGDVDDVIDRIKVAIAPLRLPAQLEEYWRQVDPRSLSLMPSPEPVSPDDALDLWDGVLREFALSPRLLFPVSSDGTGYLLVELDDGGSPGGACFSWHPAGGSFDLQAASMADYLDLVAQFIEAGEIERQEPYPPLFDPEERWEAAVERSMPPPRDVRGFEQDLRIWADRDMWPEHWRTADQLTFAGPREHLSTVDELLRAAEESGAAQGSVRVRLLGSAPSGSGRVWSVADGSGGLEVWCPASIPDREPGLDQVVELDLVVRRAGSTTDWDAVATAIQALVARGDLEAAAALGRTAPYGEFDTQARAEVTAVRDTD